MGAKITLTGVRTGRVRKTDSYYSFDMITGGSPTAPKGLPVASSHVQYTVFASLKAGKKAGLDNAPASQKWLVQGEIILDLPVNECPGEIGVIAFQLSALPSTEKESKTEAQEEKAEVAATVANAEKTPAARMIPIEQIHVPEEFLRSKLNPDKTAPVREWIQKHGQLDKPLEIQVFDKEYWLLDGYRRYVVAKEEGFTEVPIQFVTMHAN